MSAEVNKNRLVLFVQSGCVADVDECISNPCPNGATCNDLDGRFTCTCPSHLTGSRCEVRKSVRVLPVGP